MARADILGCDALSDDAVSIVTGFLQGADDTKDDMLSTTIGSTRGASDARSAAGSSVHDGASSLASNAGDNRSWGTDRRRVLPFHAMNRMPILSFSTSQQSVARISSLASGPSKVQARASTTHCNI